MLVSQVLQNECPPLKLSHTIAKGLDLLYTYNLSHIPIVNNKKQLLGSISLETLENTDENALLESIKHHLIVFDITENTLFFEAIRHFHMPDSNVVPVVDQQKKYLGYILAEDILKEFSKYPLINEPGGIIVISTNVRQYSVSEIGKIVESNNAKLLGCFISAFVNDSIEVTLKISSEDLTSVSKTFERFGYNIKFKYFKDRTDDLIDDRYNQFMKYINI